MNDRNKRWWLQILLCVFVWVQSMCTSDQQVYRGRVSREVQGIRLEVLSWWNRSEDMRSFRVVQTVSALFGFEPPLFGYNGTKPMHLYSSRAFQRHQKHDLKHPRPIDLITMKPKKLPSFVYLILNSWFCKHQPHTPSKILNWKFLNINQTHAYKLC